MSTDPGFGGRFRNATCPSGNEHLVIGGKDTAKDFVLPADFGEERHLLIRHRGLEVGYALHRRVQRLEGGWR